MPLVFVEIKSLVESNFNGIMDKLYNTILHTVGSYKRGLSMYVITNKTSEIYLLLSITA